MKLRGAERTSNWQSSNGTKPCSARSIGKGIGYGFELFSLVYFLLSLQDGGLH